MSKNLWVPSEGENTFFNWVDSATSEIKTRYWWVKNLIRSISLATAMMLTACKTNNVDPGLNWGGEKPIEKIIEREYEKTDPLMANLFTFEKANIPRQDRFDITDTIQLNGLARGHIKDTDRNGKLRDLDVSKNIWNAQVWVNMLYGGTEFSSISWLQQKFFGNTTFTNENSIIDWSKYNLVEFYNNYIKPELNKSKNKYFEKHRKIPWSQIAHLIYPREGHYISWPTWAVMEMPDWNYLIIQVEPEAGWNIESLFSVHNIVGHEFGGHVMNPTQIWQSLQVDNHLRVVDRYNHIGPAKDADGNLLEPYSLFSAIVDNFLNGSLSNTWVFPEDWYESLVSMEYWAYPILYKQDIKSNIPYINDFTNNTRKNFEDFKKKIWTWKISTTELARLKSGRTWEEPITWDKIKILCISQ